MSYHFRKRRCIHDIVKDVLECLLKGQRRVTELCLEVKLPVDRGLEILNLLINYGLVIKYTINNVTYYRITDKGYEWLGTYYHLKSILPL